MYPHRRVHHAKRNPYLRVGMIVIAGLVLSACSSAVPVTIPTIPSAEGSPTETAASTTVASPTRNTCTAYEPEGGIRITGGPFMNGAEGMAVDCAGNLYVAYGGVYRVAPDGAVSVVILGTDDGKNPVPGPVSQSPMPHVTGVAVDKTGNLYMVATATSNGALGLVSHDIVSKVAPDGTLSIVAGDGFAGDPVPGPATKSSLPGVLGLAIDATGTLYLLTSKSVLKVTADGTLSILLNLSSGIYATRIAVDTVGNVYLADPVMTVVWKIAPGAAAPSVFAGTKTTGKPSPGPATSSDLCGPSTLAVDSSGNVYIGDNGTADIDSYFVEKVDTTGILTVVAGNGKQGLPVPGPALESPLMYQITALATDPVGNLYISTGVYGSSIAKVTPDGTLSIVLKS